MTTLTSKNGGALSLICMPTQVVKNLRLLPASSEIHFLFYLIGKMDSISTLKISKILKKKLGNCRKF